MKFFETVENLLNTYNSIDVRVVAFLHDNVWKAAYLIVRFRIETEIELKKEQHDLLTKIGVIDEKDKSIITRIETAWLHIVCFELLVKKTNPS